MSKNHRYLSLAALAALAVPAAAFAQFTGTSHPDDLPVTTSPDGVRQPMVYAAARPATRLAPGPAPVDPMMAPMAPLAAAPAPTMTPRPYVAAVRPTNPDAMVVGEPMTSYPRPMRPERMDEGVVTRVPGSANGLPEGTLMRTRMLQELSTKATPEGSEWRAELLEPLVRDGQVLIPAGTVLRGKVTEVHGGRRISGEASMHLTPLALTMPDGSSLGIHAQVIDTAEFHATKVDKEGTILRRDHKKEEGGILALTAGSGAAAGAVIAGLPGALVGAGVGAGVSTAIWLKQDRQVDLARGTEVVFELTRGMRLGQEPLQ